MTTVPNISVNGLPTYPTRSPLITSGSLSPPIGFGASHSLRSGAGPAGTASSLEGPIMSALLRSGHKVSGPAFGRVAPSPSTPALSFTAAADGAFVLSQSQMSQSQVPFGARQDSVSDEEAAARDKLTDGAHAALAGAAPPLSAAQAVAAAVLAADNPRLHYGGVTDVYQRCFLSALTEEAIDRELLYSFRSSLAKVADPFTRIRREGLHGALHLVYTMSMAAAVEAQVNRTRQRERDESRAKEALGGAAFAPLSSQASSQPHHPLPAQPSRQWFVLRPFDAIRAAMADALAAADRPSQQQQQQQQQHRHLHPHQQQQHQQQQQHPHSPHSVASPARQPYGSDIWSRAQVALEDTDYTSALFRRVLVPRSEVRASMNIGAPVKVELSTEEALRWTTLQTSESTLAEQQQQQQQQPYGSSTGVSAGAGVGAVRRNALYTSLVAVTYEEQVLALRLLQGLCLTVGSQRRCIAEGCFFHYATEVLQCFLLHGEAVFAQCRRVLHQTTVQALPLLSPSGAYYVSSPLSLGSGTFSLNAHASGTRALRHANGSGALNTAATPGASGGSPSASAVGSGTFSLNGMPYGPLSSTNNVNNANGASNANANANNSSSTSTSGGAGGNGVVTLGSGVVAVDEGQVLVLIALVDAIEAACHYNPPCVTRLVQTGGVKAMLNLVYSPVVPREIRAALLDCVSVLMQEVAPFRRAVALQSAPSRQQARAAAPQRSSEEAERAEDEALLDLMLEQAMTGAMGYPGVAQLGADPAPFMMDRASASKLDSAVREWFSQHGLSHVVSGVVGLRGVKDGMAVLHQQHLPTPGSVEAQREMARAKQTREKTVSALLQAIDGRRAELQ